MNYQTYIEELFTPLIVLLRDKFGIRAKNDKVSRSWFPSFKTNINKLKLDM